MRTIRLLLVVSLTLGAAACGGDGGGGGSDECVDLTTEDDSFTLRMMNNEFVPSCFTASASQSLTLVNEDPALHTFTVRDTPIDVDIRGEETLDLDPVSGVIEPGTYELICRYHLPGMAGEVTVVE
ncbi:MAG TPA: cupredoxin domain-containing protein [Actinomycetota bacterium]|nr:cupredoxin domain-containing protein [Actinomycetota bacterium]